MQYADVIVDISHENLDRPYQYAIPKELEEAVCIGTPVNIPFGRGNRMIAGYVMGIGNVPKYPTDRIKKISSIAENTMIMESHFLQLAYWIKSHYGSTMNDALKTVLPVKQTVKEKEQRSLQLLLSEKEAAESLETLKKKHFTARARLMEALIETKQMDYHLAVNKLRIDRSVIRDFEKKGWIRIESKRIYRNPVSHLTSEHTKKTLTEAQSAIVGDFLNDYAVGKRETYLLYGITGSGKTEVYMEMISGVLEAGKQVIFLIPEISLTYQMVLRFYKRFGDRISILNSRMSKGERYDQYTRAKNGDIDIMIGPRSALFTPFERLGLIIMDEEHEGSYKSDAPPKYHAREVARERMRLLNGSLVLGSATPSLESFTKAADGDYKLYTLKERAQDSVLPPVQIVDLREELKEKNKSIFSRELKKYMEECLKKKQQIILFINRRGYAGFVSCRSCGIVMKCPHCDVSLTAHNNGTLVCHYCGHQIPKPKKCPSCSSPYIAAFGTGTQKVEELTRREFPTARILRMDTDTTSGKHGHEKILAAFSGEEADILIGTQMIVKGHDFPNVTLVGILAADLSLNAPDYRGAERTFQLLTQAAGRAGRGKHGGNVVIQTYNPEHYSITSAAEHDYETFYKNEMSYRKMMNYPPAAHILVIFVASSIEIAADTCIAAVSKHLKIQGTRQRENTVTLIGPAKASVAKIQDIYRRILYAKSVNYEELIQIKDDLESLDSNLIKSESCTIQFDFDPMNGY